MTTIPRLLLGLCLLSLPVMAQSTSTYTATSGYVGQGNQWTAHLQGGSFGDAEGQGGPNCYYGTCQTTFSNHILNYVLPDGTSARLSFSGTADFRDQFDVKVNGTASGTDSTGATINAAVHVEWSVYCRSGRGGGCYKVFKLGTLTLTQ